MNDQTKPQSGPPPLLQAMIIWGTLLFSQAMIVIISQTAVMGRPLTPPDQAAPASSLGEVNPVIFMAAAGVLLLAAIVLPQFLLSVTRRQTSTHDLKGGEMDLSQTMKKVLPVWLIRWALLEAITLMGFVSSMLKTDPAVIYPFAGIALVGFVLTVPTEAKLRSALR